MDKEIPCQLRFRVFGELGSSEWRPKNIRTALDQGINFFDTAPNYGMGTSEARLGKVFKTIDRSKVVINSKFGRLDNGEVDFSATTVRTFVMVERDLWNAFECRLPGFGHHPQSSD